MTGKIEIVSPPAVLVRRLKTVRRKRKRKEDKKEDNEPKKPAAHDMMQVFEAAFKLTKRDVLEEVKKRRQEATQEDIDDIIVYIEKALQNGEVTGAENLEKAVSFLGLLYVQEEDFAGARDLLTDHGYRYRLSTNILRYPIPAGKGEVTPFSRKYVTAYDNALPDSLYKVVKEGFSARSPFWSEHSYRVGITPYFSYRHDLHGKPVTAMDQVVRRVAEIMMKDIPGAADAKYAEWWAHCRPHTDGHQLHYDADNEGKGGVRNPLANCIIFLSTEGGGPTLITTQKHGDKELSQEGWFMYPKENRIVAYPANILHGVIPGRGPIPDPSIRRITLMVALWGDTGCTLRPSATPDASRPFPAPQDGAWITRPDKTPYTWPSKFPITKLSKQDKLTPVPPVPVNGLWEDVCLDDNKRAKTNLARLKAMPHYDLCFQGF